MPLGWIIVIDLVVVYLLFGNSLIELFKSRSRRRRDAVLGYIRHIRHAIRRDRDRISPDDQTWLNRALADLEARAKDREGDPDTVAAAQQELHEKVARRLPTRRSGLAEWIEVAVVAGTVAFGFRSFFLQPFRIPTGSMQPTLYGIHAEPLPGGEKPGRLRGVFDLLHFGKRHAYAVAEKDTQIKGLEPRNKPFFKSSALFLDDRTVTLPGTPDQVRQFVNPPHQQPEGGLMYRAGEVIAEYSLTGGDHLFVNRVAYQFREPRRGDIAVFTTDGLAVQTPDGPRFLSDRGRYYIKRLIGLPGDTLKIQDNRILVKPAGATEFRPLDAGDAPAFERIYSMQGGYQGHSQYPNARYLSFDGDAYVVPDNHYFMLGDNTNRSQDSRFWGSVPRRNLVGRAAIVFWPFSDRWGLAGEY